MAVVPETERVVNLNVRDDGSVDESATVTGVFLAGPETQVALLLSRMRNKGVVIGKPAGLRPTRYCGDRDED